MTNPAPLEKQLLHLTLNKGVNERDRPETADPSTCLTRVENLVQDQTGAYIKCPGQTLLGPQYAAVKALRTVNGLAVIRQGVSGNQDGRLVPYLEGAASGSQWSEREDMFLPILTGSAEFILSSGPHVVPKIGGVATCTKFHAMVVEMGINASGGGPARSVVLYDRNAGAVVVKYDLERIRTGGSENIPKIAFVEDRYLHVFFNVGADIYGFVVDTSATITAESAIVETLLLSGAGATELLDIAVSNTDGFLRVSRSYLLVDFAGASTCLSMSNAAALVDSVSLAGTGAEPALQICTNDSSDWLFWICSTQIGANVLADLTVAVAPADHSGGATITSPQICLASSNRVYCLSEAAVTFGAATVNRITARRATTDGGTTLSSYATIDGWELASTPFIYASAVSPDTVLVQLVKESSLDAVAHVVADVTSGRQGLNVGSATTYNSFRVAAVLEPFVGTVNVSKLRYLHSSYSSSSVSPAVAVQTVARGFGYAIFTLTSGHQNVASQNFGGATYISGGCHAKFCGDTVAEVGFVDLPNLNVQAGAAGVLTGAYKYIAVHKHVDETGSVAYSRLSEIFSITHSADQGDVTISPCAITCRDQVTAALPLTLRVITELYRTKVGGTIYYLCASSQVGTPAPGLATQVLGLTAGPFFTVSDNLSDATLGAQPQLFRQPGTPNSAVDRYPAPNSNILCQHKDRLFTTDPYGARVYYSSFFVDGETAWHNPAFSFFVHGGSGPITGLVSMDGRLFIFKRDAIFVVDGDGPAEGGVTGNEYSPPQKLATPFGCIDHRSIAVTSNGIIYRSANGIEILTRSLQVKFIGDRVFQTVDTYTETVGATVGADGLVRIAINSSGGDGRIVVYDPTLDAWTTINLIASGVTTANLLATGETVVYLQGGIPVYEAPGSGLGYAGTYIPWVIETGWLRTGQNARGRFSKILGLLKKLSGANHKVTFSVAFDYVDSYTQVATWEPGVINALGIEALEVQLANQEVRAVRFKMEDGLPTARSIASSTFATPIVVTHATAHGFVNGDTIVIADHLVNTAANGTWVVAAATDLTYTLTASVGNGVGGATGTATYPVGTGRGADVLGITLEVAIKTGAPKVAAGQKA